MADTAITHTPSQAATAPVVFVHGPGSDSLADALARRSLIVFSRQSLAGAKRTDAGPDQLGALCADVARQAPGKALVLLHASLSPSAGLLDDLAGLLDHAPGPGVYTVFSNADPRCNPFAGLDNGQVDGPGRERLVALLGSGRLLPLDTWPDHLLALTADAVAELADPGISLEDAPGHLRQRLVQAELADWLYVDAPGMDPTNEPRLEPHEERRPAPWGSLSERLQAWLSALRAQPERARELPRPGSAPLTLHVTHSWGGGVAAWVRSMIDGDPDGIHLQLRSEGPQSGQGAGQRLALYLGNQLDAPLAQWWLQPAIRAVETRHSQYREALETLCQRYGVGRVIVSSLVGHSLDALRTERPTVQVLHDAFPAWPLLSIHPREYGGDLEAAMRDARAKEQFPDLSLQDWTRIAEQYREAAQHVVRVAPSRSAREVFTGVCAGVDKDHIELIPHGLPPLRGPTPTPRDRADGRLQVVIPGRVQSGKGVGLLERALPSLRDVAQVTLLGTGKGGERFFGMSGVNVVPEYHREDLPILLASLGPHCAVLPSVVPETFSYTLSEMFALGVPVVATRLGSFEERIADGETGWLVEPSAEALVTRIRSLANDRGALAEAHQRLSGQQPRTLVDMVADYDRLCGPVCETPRLPARSNARLGLYEAQAAAAADQLRRTRTRLAEAAAEQDALRARVEQRTRWAEDEKRQRKAWVTSLQAELDEARAERDAAAARSAEQEQELSARARHIATLDEQIEQHSAALAQAQADYRDAEHTLQELSRVHTALAAERDALRTQLDTVLGSHSWKLTMPLRVTRRVLAAAAHQRAWNPLRWPLLLSQTVRNLSTVGLGGTLRRMQHFGAEQSAPVSERPDQPLETPVEVALPRAVPRADSPRVSIVIPAYNHLEHTGACLQSIARAHCETPFEVIVVDDESSDDTADRLPDVHGLRYLRNDRNQGFIRSCNRGAGLATGDYVLFLNNDTQVADGWLDTLLGTFDQRPDAGLVGARLVYPDGTLQECGGMVFSDGSGWNYGRGDDPDRPEYQALREVDYCSGACIVLPRALLEELGGFDEHYAPAYYEDTDLAFRVRQAGRKVFVQPRASIIHFEGVSSGTDLASGTKRYQVVNREKFLARWKTELAEQPAPIADPQDAVAVRRARDHRLRGRVLVVDAYTPEPDQDSGSVRLVNLMRCLQDLDYGVTFFPDNRAWNGDYTRALQDLGVEAWYDPWLRSSEAFLEGHGVDFEHVIVSRHYVACNYLGVVRRLAPQAKFVFDTVDLHYLREQRLADLENSAALRQVAKQTRRSELAVIRAADATLVVSPVERELLAEEVPDATVMILSNIHEINTDAAGFDERSDLYFVGGYQHPPNIDAAHWFVTEIWPRVRERLPGVRFHLVGSKATDEVRALGDAEGVTFHGFVESLAPFLDRCRLSVAPLRYGAGVKGKVNQAMAHGQPVVATPAAVEGIHAEDGEDVLVAKDADAFADAVVRLYGDEALWQRLSANGLRNVQRHFSREAARRDLRALFAALED